MNKLGIKVYLNNVTYYVYQNSVYYINGIYYFNHFNNKHSDTKYRIIKAEIYGIGLRVKNK